MTRQKVASRNAATCSKQSVVLGFKNGSSVILGGHSLLSCLGIRFLFQQPCKEVVGILFITKNGCIDRLSKKILSITLSPELPAMCVSVE